MKLKSDFRGLLLLVRRKKMKVRHHYKNDPELYYAIGLVMLWLVAFIIIHLKYL